MSDWITSAGRGFPYSPGSTNVTTAPRVSGPSNRPDPLPRVWPRVPPDRPIVATIAGGTPRQIPAGAYRAPRSAPGAGLRRTADGDVQTPAGMCARQHPLSCVTCNTGEWACQETLCRVRAHSARRRGNASSQPGQDFAALRQPGGGVMNASRLEDVPTSFPRTPVSYPTTAASAWTTVFSVDWRSGRLELTAAMYVGTPPA